MATLKDAEKVADDLENLVSELRSVLQDGDFGRLTEVADQISERADGVAETFSTINDALMARVGEAGGAKSGRSSKDESQNEGGDEGDSERGKRSSSGGRSSSRGSSGSRSRKRSS